MQILHIQPRNYGEQPVALHFDTDEQVQFAWQWIVENRRLDSFSYRPKAEGIDNDRAFVEDYLSKYRTTGEFRSISAALIRRLIQNFWGEDLNRTIAALITPTREVPHADA